MAEKVIWIECGKGVTPRNIMHSLLYSYSEKVMKIMMLTEALNELAMKPGEYNEQELREVAHRLDHLAHHLIDDLETIVPLIIALRSQKQQ